MLEIIIAILFLIDFILVLCIMHINEQMDILIKFIAKELDYEVEKNI